jgi:hypothetical protein
MEKDLGRIKKNNDTDVIIRIDDFGGKIGLTIREYVNSSPSGYKGFTKAGTRIPLESLEDFKKMISEINTEDLKKEADSLPKTGQKKIDSEESSYI